MNYEELRRLVESIKFDLKALIPEIRDRGRTRQVEEENGRK